MADKDKIRKEMQERIDVLDRAARAYYAEGAEIMSNFEYDRIYDELLELERESGIVLPGSPTQRVGYEVLSELPKERHPSRMLSLNKTKSREELRDWLGDQEGLLSWKMDGLTIVLTYEGGALVKAVTRGNGDVGEVITGNAKTFVNLPQKIVYQGRLILRGEAVISYRDFEEINASISEAESRYKNPRNLCAGSVRQLDSRVTASRRVRFCAFTLVSTEPLDASAEEPDFHRSREEQMKWLAAQGFEVVEYRRVDRSSIMAEIERFAEAVTKFPLPSDGLVLTYDDTAYGAALGATAKYPRDAIAFKWQDQTAQTILRGIEWSASRTGLINPIAVFDPVELEGTTVSRASVHNVSIMEELRLGIGDTIKVYKANMIIPQIAENLTKSGPAPVPSKCPVCGQEALIKDEKGVKTLCCPSPDCPAKQLKGFALFVSRDAMNIDGLSEMTLEKLIGRGLIKEFADIFRVESFREEIVGMEGFGKKSFDNLKASVDRARHTSPERLLYALGIPGFGAANARVIARHCENSWRRISSLDREELLTIDGIGEVLADAYTAYFSDPAKQRALAALLQEIEIDESFEESGGSLSGLIFVITGSLRHYANRSALKREIEAAGGRVAASVSARTSYLINNDLNSASGKNKKAGELGVPVIDEDTVRGWLGEGGAPRPPRQDVRAPED